MLQHLKLTNNMRLLGRATYLTTLPEANLAGYVSVLLKYTTITKVPIDSHQYIILLALINRVH